MSTATAFTAPESGEYNEYYHPYISKVDPSSVVDCYANQPKDLKDALANLPAGEDSKLHEPYTWTIKQVVGHMIDTERVFGMRMLRIAVADPAESPGMDQNHYVDNMDYESVSLDDLISEFTALRQSNVLLVNRIPAEQFANRGVASGFEISAKAILFILTGHVIYHLEIIRKRLAG